MENEPIGRTVTEEFNPGLTQISLLEMYNGLSSYLKILAEFHIKEVGGVVQKLEQLKSQTFEILQKEIENGTRSTK